MKIKFGLAGMCALALSGCAHTNKETVAMKVSGREAHVTLGQGEVTPGDRISFYRKKCSPAPPELRGVETDPVCEKIKIGEGTVNETLGKDYSKVTIDDGTNVNEGDLVSKK